MKIGKKKILFVLILLLGIILVYYNEYFYCVVLLILAIFLYLCFVLNKNIYESLFPPKEMIVTERNYDCIVIGDLGLDGKSIEGKKVLRFQFPNRTLFASYIILQHVFSWLKEENGEVIILANKNGLSKKEISVYDYPLLHRITLKKLGLKGTTPRNSLFINPLLSLKYLFKVSSARYEIINPPLPELIDFCEKRRIQLTVMSSL